MTWVKHGKTLVTFAGHIVTAAVIFSIVGLGVCGLHKMSELFASLGIGELYVHGIHALEALLFVCDLIATAVWAVTSTIEVIRELKENDDEKDK